MNLEMNSKILFLTDIVIYKITADSESVIERKIGCESDTE